MEAINFFWYLAIYIAKKLLRGALWKVHVWDARIKEYILKMLEWHARALNGWEYDTWYNGHFLDEWADPYAVKELEKAFAHYDKDDCRRALLATMDLFRRLTKETAQQLNYPYPQTTDDNISGWIKKHLHVYKEIKR
jgi:aminoglycoside 6-adenylyltransferase